MILIGGLAVIAILGLCAAFTAVGVWLIERAHRPAGVLVPVSGGRLHVVELGRAQASRAPPFVLLHGASGNLEDQRLILGNRLAATRRVILIDRPGHGFSDRPGAPAGAPPRPPAS